MGTSTSRRSPPTTRFGAFRTALASEPARAAAELYVATAPGWQAELAGPPVAAFAAAAWNAHTALGEQLAAADNTAAAIAAVVTAARNAAIEESGGSLAVAVGERAFARLLLSTIGDTQFGADAAHTWREQRGASPDVLVRRLVGEVTRQLALHVTSRDVAQLVGPERRTAGDARALVREVADRAASLAADATATSSFTPETLRADWARAIQTAFTAGRRQRGASGA